jgi:hypothetical protein
MCFRFIIILHCSSNQTENISTHRIHHTAFQNKLMLYENDGFYCSSDMRGNKIKTCQTVGSGPEPVQHPGSSSGNGRPGPPPGPPREGDRESNKKTHRIQLGIPWQAISLGLKVFFNPGPRGSDHPGLKKALKPDLLQGPYWRLL